MARRASKKTTSQSKKAGASRGSRSPGREAARSGSGGVPDRLGATLGRWIAGRELDERTSSHLREVQGLLLLAISIWLGVSLFTFYTPYEDPLAARHNWGGRLGKYLAHLVLLSIGWGGYLLVALGLAWGAVGIAGRAVAFPLLRVFGGLCFLVSSAFLLQLAFGAGFSERLTPGGAGANSLPYGPGGWAAMVLVGPQPDGATGGDGRGPLLIEVFGRPGIWILLSLIALSSFTLATERGFYPALAALGGWLRERREEQGEGVLSALVGFAKRLGTGWWDFLRGADLVVEAPSESRPAAGRSRIKPQRRSAPQAPEPGEPGDEASFDEPADAEGEYGELDEEGELDGEGELEDDEEEEEYEDGEEYDEEGFEEDEDGAEPEEVEEYAEDEGWEEVTDRADPELAAGRAAAKEKLAESIRQQPKPLVFDPPTPPPGPWKFPPLSLLEAPDPGQAHGGKEPEAIEQEAERLEHVLRSFRVDAQVVGSSVGPAVTMYELEVASGVRMNKVTALSQEIAAALRARSIRIIAPIPGKSTIGVEVPNANRRLVRFSELIHKKAYDKKFAGLPLFLGMNAEGAAVVEDLARMPHLLIAGQTGAGKSVSINTIIASLLLTRSPHDAQMILVDPKMVELAMYSDVPHLMAPVVTDMKEATRVLEWAVEKMESRYELFKQSGVRNLSGYNALGENELRKRMGDDFNEERTPRHVPYIVIVIDELADLMMVSKKEAEHAITRLAQKSRAVGIHLIVATQRPSTDVITGVLKANLPTRIAFTVASKIDSRVILDVQGAEKLLGRGDMLYNPPQASRLERVQGALVDDHELEALVDFVASESAPNFSQELIQAASGERGDPESDEGLDFAARDDMWDRAVRVVLETQRGSASLLQRALGIGYTRASRLIDMMGEAGIVGTHKGSKSREILLTLDDWDEMQGAGVGSATRDD